MFKIGKPKTVAAAIAAVNKTITDLQEVAEEESIRAAELQESIARLEIERQASLTEKGRAEVLSSRFKALVEL